MSDLLDVPEQYRDWYEVIDDPLAWQAKIDATGLHPNTRGSARFWTTAAAYGLDVVTRNGIPDCSQIVIGLAPGLGLELSTDETSPFIRYRFVAIQEGIDGN